MIFDMDGLMIDYVEEEIRLKGVPVKEGLTEFLNKDIKRCHHKLMTNPIFFKLKFMGSSAYNKPIKGN
ncbi:MAG: hypothetical protein ACI4EO_10715 [Blautia sp.]